MGTLSYRLIFLFLVLWLPLIGHQEALAQKTAADTEPIKNQAPTVETVPTKPGPYKLLPGGKKNYTTFPKTVYVSGGTGDYFKHTPAEYHQHPEFGTVPFLVSRKDVIELIDRRTLKSRYFINPSDPNKFMIHQGYGNIHYRDDNGWLRTVDPRLRPAEGKEGVYHAPFQPAPVTVNLKENYTSIRSGTKGPEFKFNSDLNVIVVGKDGSRKVLGLIRPNSANTSVGMDGAYSKEVMPGIDREVTVQTAEIKTNFILRRRISELNPQTDRYLAFEEEIDLPAGYSLTELATGTGSRSPEGYFAGDLAVRDKDKNVVFKIGKPEIFDATHNADWMTTGFYGLIRKGKKTVLTYYVSVEWLTAAHRAYPVTVDPSIRELSSFPREISYYNNIGPDGSRACFVDHCQEDSPGGYKFDVNLPPRSQITDVNFLIYYNILTGSNSLNAGFVFAGQCGTSPETADIGGRWSCTSSYNGGPGRQCGRVLDDDGNPIPYPMPGAGSCLTASCQPTTVPFYMRAYGCNCGTGDVCKNSCHNTPVNGWQMFVDGETVRATITSRTGSNDTTDVCDGEVLQYSASAEFGVPPYVYNWREETTGTTGSDSVFTFGGMQAGRTYKINLSYSDNCNDPLTQSYVIRVRKGPSMELDTVPPTCPTSKDGSIRARVTGETPASNQPTSPGCPLTTQDLVAFEKPGNAFSSGSPLRGAKLSARTLFLVRAAEIKALNPEVANGGKLTSISFFIALNKKLSQGPYENYTVRIMPTPATNLNRTNIAGYNGKVVYGPGIVNVRAGQWNTIQFTNGFLWNGTDNLIFDFCHSNRFSIQGNDEMTAHNTDFATGNTFRDFATQCIALYTNDAVKKEMCGNATPADYDPTEFRPNFRLTFCRGFELQKDNKELAKNKTGVFDGLGVGEYRVIYVDPSGCGVEKAVTLKRDSMKVKVSKCPDNNGFLTADVTGGNAPYQFKFGVENAANFKAENTVAFSLHTDLNAFYNLTVKDAKGCEQTFQYDIFRNIGNLIADDYARKDQTSCPGGKDGSWEIQVDEATVNPPYKVSVWRAGNRNDTLRKVIFPGGRYRIDSLRAGDYQYLVIDSDNCRYTDAFTITEPLPLTYTVTLTDSAYCNDARGAIRIDFSNGTPPYKIEMRKPDGTVDILTADKGSFPVTGLSPGNYTFQITDNGNCAATPVPGNENPFTVPAHTNIPELSFASPPVGPKCPNSTDGEIVLNISKGTVPLEFQIFRDGTSIANGTLPGRTVDRRDLISGSYRILITDANGCTAETTQVLTSAEPFNIVKGLDQKVCINQSEIRVGSDTDSPAPGQWICTGCPPNFYKDDVRGVVNPAVLTVGSVYDLNYVAKNCTSLTVKLQVLNNSAGPDGEICENDASFTPEGPAIPGTGTWSASAGIRNIDPATGQVELNNTVAPGTYLLIYNAEVSPGLTCSDTMRLTVKPAPTVSQTTRNYCIPRTGYTGTVNLASGTDNPPGGTWASLTPGLITDAAQGTFDFAASSGWGPYDVFYIANGCSARVTVRLSGVELPSKTAQVCKSERTFTPPVPNPTGGAWSTTESRLGINAGTGTVNLETVPAGIYTLRYDETPGNPASCFDTFRLVVKANPVLAQPLKPICIDIKNPSGTVNLASLARFDSTGGTWAGSPGNAALITDAQNGTFNIASTQGPGTYQVLYTYNGCSTPVAVTLGGVSAENDTAFVCENALSFTPKAGIPANKFWLAEDPKVVIDRNTGVIQLNRNLPAGVYKIIYTEDANNPDACKDEFNLTVRPAPKADFDMPPYPNGLPYFIVQRETLNLAPKNVDGITGYRWEMGDGSAPLTSPTVSYTYQKKGTYQVKLTLTHESGCTDDITKEVVFEEPLEFNLPNVITPNNDGFNDFLVVPSSQDYEVKLYISDRVGNKVYGFPEDGNRWEPKSDLADGTYFYVLELNNRVTKSKLIKSGNITILR